MTTMIPSRASTTTLLHRLQRGLSDFPVELVYTPHERWPYPYPRAHPDTQQSFRPMRISVLDSSFNPPTLAHLALINTHRPSCNQGHHDSSLREDYDARLLLFSVKNADKLLKPTDASHIQRLEMMLLLVKDIHKQGIHRTSGIDSSANASASAGEGANVAVAITNEPTFVGKSSALLAFLQRRLASLTPFPFTSHESTSTPNGPSAASTPPQFQPQLTFLIGIDTLERLFSPRYYDSPSFPSLDPTTHMLSALGKFFSPFPEGDGSRVVCARRGISSDPKPTITLSQDQNQPENTKERLPGSEDQIPILAKEFVATQRIVLIDIGEDERTFSSTVVREMRRRGDTGWRRLVPGSIAEYVEREGLYASESEGCGLKQDV